MSRPLDRRPRIWTYSGSTPGESGHTPGVCPENLDILREYVQKIWTYFGRTRKNFFFFKSMHFIDKYLDICPTGPGGTAGRTPGRTLDRSLRGVGWSLAEGTRFVSGVRWRSINLLMSMETDRRGHHAVNCVKLY